MTNGGKLNIIQYGKPHLRTYSFAIKRMERLCGHTVTRVYGIGDNPKSDIQGINSRKSETSHDGVTREWVSILVRTGCFVGGANDETNPADAVFDDVYDALKWIRDREHNENNSR